MDLLTETAVKNAKTGLFTIADAQSWFNGGHASLLVALSRAMASGDVIHIRRGLYRLSRQLSPVLPNPYVIANLVYGPSYVSMESALEYHGLIPEAVQIVFSVTGGRAKTFATPAGTFKYLHVPQFPLMAGVERHDDDPSGVYFVATPLKAICDIVAARRLDWTSLEPFFESYRLDEETTRIIGKREISNLLEVYHSGRVHAFLEGLKKEKWK
jgi:hypothetical protein